LISRLSHEGRRLANGVSSFEQILRGVPQVRLHDVAGQLDEVMAEGRVVKGTKLGRTPVDRLEVVRRHSEVVLAARLDVALEQMHLHVTETEPLHRQAEVRCRKRDRAE
jgi:hypothetical protein